MADSIDAFKPPAVTSLSADVRSNVPAQQARPGRSGFDGGSYFESTGGGSAHPGRAMLHPPPTTGPKASPSEVLAQTLEAFRQLHDGSPA